MSDEKTENIVGALVLALSDAIIEGAEKQAPEPGPAAAAIALLAHEPGMPIERLRRALGLSHPGAVRLIDRLAADALVERRASLADRRAVALFLTARGAERSRAILDARQARIAAALGHLDPGERAILGGLAAKLLVALVGDVDQAYATCRLCDASVCRNCPVEAALGAAG